MFALSSPCPRCGQDYPVKMRVVRTKDAVVVCPECEALWPEGVPFAAEAPTDMQTYLRQHGLRGEWTELAEEIP